MKPTLEYIISATGMMNLFGAHQQEPWYPLFKSTALSLMDELQEKVANDCKNSNSFVSILFNAFTEAGLVRHFTEFENIHGKAVYADSGGLQIVTLGKEITPEIQQKIYQTQSYADFAMAFDVIPVSTLSQQRTRNERSNLGNRVFNAHAHEEAALATGDNVKAQVDTFRALGAKTKVIIIVQGNNSDDIVNYYKGIASKLSPEDFEYIGGLAVGHACMGFGELETIEVLYAAKKIAEIAHPNVSRHLHILGVGSLYRMRPSIYLVKSGFLDDYKRISYDSSSHTTCFQYGLLKMDGHCDSIGTHRTPYAEETFRNIYRFFKTYSSLVTEDEFVDNIFGKELGKSWSFAAIKQRILSGDFSHNDIVGALTSNAAYTYYQIHNFTSCLDKMLEDEFLKAESNAEWKKVRHINSLLNVKTIGDMEEWFSGAHAQKAKSKRIKRSTAHRTVTQFFQ